MWPLTPSLRRKPHFWDPLHELSRTGEWTDVPRERLLDEVRRYGGHVTFGDRTFVIWKERVRRVELTRAALLRPFLYESDIEARLGWPTNVLRRGTSYVERRYEELDLGIEWNVYEERMGRLVVGSSEPLAPPLTRVGVLRSWLDVANWLKGGEPAGAVPHSTVIRHKRLLALLNA